MAYRQMWEIEIRHEGLNKYRHIRGADEYVVEQKALSQRLVWDEMWVKKLEIEEGKKIKRQVWRNKEDLIKEAAIKTKDAQEYFKSLEGILSHTLKVNDAIGWAKLLNNKNYTVKEPKSIAFSVAKPIKSRSVETIPEPTISDTKYLPSYGLIDRFSSKSKQKKLEVAEKLFNIDYEAWTKTRHLNNQANIALENEYQENLKKWEDEKTKHEQNEVKELKN